MTSRSSYLSAIVATGSAPQRILAQVRMPARLNHTAVISKHAGRDPKFLVGKEMYPAVALRVSPSRRRGVRDERYPVGRDTRNFRGEKE